MDVLGIVIIALLFIAVVIWVATIPITIAKSRGVTGSELSTISCLSWLSLLMGLTWFVALVLALTYQPKRWVDKEKGSTNLDLDALDKLYQLKEKGVLSPTEYNREKAKLMNQSAMD